MWAFRLLMAFRLIEKIDKYYLKSFNSQYFNRSQYYNFYKYPYNSYLVILLFNFIY